LRGGRLVGHELIDPHHDPRPFLDLALVAIRGFLDLPLHERDGRDRSPEIVDASDVRRRLLLDLSREALHRECSAERIDGGRHPRLVRENLLGPERDADGLLAGK
jgi:hypothetical protein